MREWQKCPKCDGQGHVAKPSYVPEGVYEWTSTSATHLCDVCNGMKIIERPIDENPDNLTNPAAKDMKRLEKKLTYEHRTVHGMTEVDARYNAGFNDACDEWEKYLSSVDSADRGLIPLDWQKVQDMIISWHLNGEASERKKFNYSEIAKKICNTFGQPKPSVPSEEEISFVVADYFKEQHEKHSKAIKEGDLGFDGGWSTKTEDVVKDLSQAIHNLITAKREK